MPFMVMDEKTTNSEMEWSVCPAKMYTKRAVFGWLIIVLFGGVIVTTNLILGICMAAVLIATQATFLFSTRFTISEDGLLAKYPIRTKFCAWKQIRRANFLKEACFMFTRKKPSNLDGWTGMTVFYGENRDEIIAAIKSHLEPEVVL